MVHIAKAHKKTRILLTSVGGHGVPRLLEAIRTVPELDVIIIGVDARRDAIGAHFVDEFYTVPYGTAPEYLDEVLRLCSERHVQVVVPLSDEEALQLSAGAARFSDTGVTIIGSSYETTRLASNKFQFLSKLKACGVETPLAFVPTSVAEVELALEALGFPRRPVVLKPLQAHGSRGFRLVVSELDEFAYMLTNTRDTLISARRLVELLKRQPTVPAFLLMEYLEGNCYSVDVLVESGTTSYVIPQRKLRPRHGSLESGCIEKNAEVNACVERIVAAFDFRYLINIDMAYRTHPAEGAILPFDLNVRPSAVIAATQAAGCFLLAEAIFMALGVERPRNEFHPVKVDRYWAERYDPIP